MKSKLAALLLSLAGFLLAVGLAALALWNPGNWRWANRLRGIAGPAQSQAAMQGDNSQAMAMSQQAPTKERKILYWRAPMNPNYISDKPGKSPMGMDLVPVYADEENTTTGIKVDPGFVQNFAIRVSEAKRGTIPIDIRTVGILAYNEKTIASINTKFEGWIENARVNYVGESVKKGQVLFEVYSPQLVTTQQEYLSAREYLNRLSSSGADPDAVGRARSLVEAARERLRYWDVTDDQIDQLAQSSRVTRTLKVTSPVSGMVIYKMDPSLEGMRLTPGMKVFKFADLSTIWVQIEVFEYQIQYLHIGQTAQIDLDAFPSRHWQGKLIYLNPAVDPKTRTLKAYLEIPNPDLTLRPEMYANVQIHIPAVTGAVIIPEEAVLHSGERNVIIVEKDGRFEPREVDLGVQGGGFHEVLRGLRPGEKVVVSSQFLIDSESNLKEAINKMLGDSTGEQSTNAPMQMDN